MKSDVVKRKMKIFINGLQKNDPEIMPDPPVKYLKNDKCNQMYRLFSTTFIYVMRGVNMDQVQNIIKVLSILNIQNLLKNIIT